MSVELPNVVPDQKKLPLISLKGDLLNAPVLAFLEKFNALVSKKKKLLSKGEILFEP